LIGIKEITANVHQMSTKYVLGNPVKDAANGGLTVRTTSLI